MNQLAYILAKGDTGWVQIAFIAVLIGLSLIGSAIQKAKAKAEEEKSRKPRSGSAEQGTKPRPRFVQPKSPARATPPQAPVEQPVRVSQELRMRQQRQAQIEADRQKRLAMRKSPESDSSAIEARLVSIRAAETTEAPRKIGKIGTIMQLDTPAAAKRAIIMHEIFSPPKALRQGGEMWDE
jgi:hypothetical protein